MGKEARKLAEVGKVVLNARFFPALNDGAGWSGVQGTQQCKREHLTGPYMIYSGLSHVETAG